MLVKFVSGSWIVYVDPKSVKFLESTGNGTKIILNNEKNFFYTVDDDISTVTDKLKEGEEGPNTDKAAPRLHWKNDSVLCPHCGSEFTMPLIEMVRRNHPWCDGCVALADRIVQEAIKRALERAGEGEGREE